jgi:hypothetical protein
LVIQQVTSHVSLLKNRVPASRISTSSPILAGFSTIRLFSLWIPERQNDRNWFWVSTGINWLDSTDFWGHSATRS